MRVFKKIKTGVLPLLESVMEKVLREEQKLSKEETRGWEYISEKAAAGTNPAPTGRVPRRGAEKGMLGAMVAPGRAPLTTALGWKRKGDCSHPGQRGLPKRPGNRIQFAVLFIASAAGSLHLLLMRP